MRKAKILAAAILIIGLLGGCSKFSPDETTAVVTKDGTIKTAVIDTLDESYYSAEELEKNVQDAVTAYNQTAGADNIKIDKFDIEESIVKLFVDYTSAQDYKEFNNVDFYIGDITDAYNNAGYRFESTFQEVDNGEVSRSDVAKEEIFAGTNHPLVIFHEEMEVEVPGKILFASSNLEITGKKTAKWKSQEASGETETESASETQAATETGSETEEILEIKPVAATAEAEAGDHLAYIIYE